jgi:hypothetical protein
MYIYDISLNLPWKEKYFGRFCTENQNTVNSMCLIDGPVFPSKVSSKCPAIMFSVKRTASVPGRIRLLIVSIITINGINMVGLPWGTRCSYSYG